MTAPSDPKDDPPRPVLSRGFWLMIALSGLSLAAAAVVAFRPPRPLDAQGGGSNSTLSSPPSPHATAHDAKSRAPVDLSDPEAWLEAEDSPPDQTIAARATPAQAVEVDDEFGAALQPAGGASLVGQTTDLLRALGEWSKGR